MPNRWIAGDRERRPDPDQLLRRVEAAERSKGRGRLKVFLGYASRVGKSFRMLDEGRRRKMRGQDVVVGAVQSELSPEVQELLQGLEVIPTLQMTVDGVRYDVLDLPSLLRRRPQVCLVDELAYDNPSGSRNRHRWQDVNELLDNGITVVTAVNLQHIAEQQDAIEKITGKRAAPAVPQDFIRTADEIVLVDAAPEDLRQREASGRAVDFRRLLELRELALLLAAEVVEGQLQRYVQSQGLEMFPGSQERILVCLTPRSNARRMLESGRRNADRFHCDLLVLYVRQPGISRADETAVERHLELARELGAKVYVVDAADSAQAIIDFARSHRVTQLFVGHSLSRGWRALISRNPLDRLIRAAQNMDIRIFPHPETP